MTTKPLLVFDGVCVLCSRILCLVMWADRKAQRLQYATAQSDLGQKMLSQYSYDLDEYETILLISADGDLSVKSDSVIEIAKILGGAWHLLRLLKILPKSWRDKLYDFVAKRRYHWFGKSDYCERIPEKYLNRIIR